MVGLVLSFLVSVTPASAREIVTSPRPDAVEVTVYRSPHRTPGEKLQLHWLNGFALITETRRVSIPGGETNLRFKGVAGGIVPESAIVTGLPTGVIEKNQDAYLLSPGSLLDSSLGRRVHLRRTSVATGEVSQTEAVIRTGAEGAVVLETPAGIEALRCSGLKDTLVFDSVPDGLVDEPTLSVRVRSPAPAEAVVTLSYLASGFDWQADYVAELSRDGRQMDLFAWLTLANGDETGFRDADTNAVAGRLNRQELDRMLPQRPPITLRCWPQGTTTSDLPLIEYEIVVTGSRAAFAGAPPPPPPPPPPAPPPPPPPAMEAVQEELGDLKLYRVPEPVTVAARSLKQVAFLRRQGIPVETAYRLRIGGPGSIGGFPTIVARNVESERLGVPLPAGEVVFFQRLGDRRVMIGRGRTGDLAVGEELEVPLGPSTDVQVVVTRESESSGRDLVQAATVTNAKDRPVRFEGEIETGDDSIIWSSAKLGTRDGRPLWSVTVPANGSVTLRYRVRIS